MFVAVHQSNIHLLLSFLSSSHPHINNKNTAPVIHNIHTSKTVLGLSPTSTYSEVILYSNAAYYNLLRGNPFTAYGETFMVMIQTFIVVIMIWIYKEPKVKMRDVVVPLLVYGLYVYVVFRGKFHHE